MYFWIVTQFREINILLLSYFIQNHSEVKYCWTLIAVTFDSEQKKSTSSRGQDASVFGILFSHLEYFLSNKSQVTLIVDMRKSHF